MEHWPVRMDKEKFLFREQSRVDLFKGKCPKHNNQKVYNRQDQKRRRVMHFFVEQNYLYIRERVYSDQGDHMGIDQCPVFINSDL